MIRCLLTILLLLVTLSGCSLAGDITPPAQIATAQADRILTPTIGVPPQETEQAIPSTQSPQSRTEAASEGTIIGVVENGTSGGSVPNNLEVNLIASDQQALAYSSKTTTDESGRFIFENIEVEPGRIFLAYVDYEDVRYVSAAQHFPGGGANLDLSLNIFETTDDDSGLHVQRLHLIFKSAGEDMIGVTQVWIINGLDDRTIVERQDGPGVVDIRLPQGFSNLGIDDSISPEGRYLLSDTGFLDRAPVQPGKPVELVFGFNLPYESGFDYSQTMLYPVDAVVVMLMDEALSVHNAGLEDLGRRDMAEVSMRSYSMGALESGKALELRVGSKVSLFRGDNAMIAYISGAILFIAIALIVLLRFLRERREIDDVGLIPRDSHDDSQELIKAIAALDDAYEAGEITEDEYQSHRAKLKGQALQLMRGDDD